MRHDATSGFASILAFHHMAAYELPRGGVDFVVFHELKGHTCDHTLQCSMILRVCVSIASTHVIVEQKGCGVIELYEVHVDLVVLTQNICHASPGVGLSLLRLETASDVHFSYNPYSITFSKHRKVRHTTNARDKPSNMPTKKKNTTRAAQLHPQPAQSDYDTDTANMTESAPAMAPPPARTNTELNLLVLRRYVPETDRIISIAPFAVVYVFSPDTQGWEKCGIEGTLFVCQLSGSQYPRYNVVILNRKSLDNFVTELVSEDDIEITEQYVILQVQGEDGVPTIYGLWIFSDEGEGVHTTKDIVANAMQECAMRASHSNFSANGNGHDQYSAPNSMNFDGATDMADMDVATPVQPQSVGQSIDLLSLFNKAPAVAPAADHGPPSNSYQHQPSQFTPNADTDFFRSTHGPAGGTQAQAQAPRPVAQQNALLDLFKNAGRG